MLARRRLAGTCLLCTFHQLQRSSLRRLAIVNRTNNRALRTSNKGVRLFTTTTLARSAEENDGSNDSADRPVGSRHKAWRSEADKTMKWNMDQEKLDIMREMRGGGGQYEAPPTVAFEDIVSRLHLNRVAEEKEQMDRRDGTRDSLPDVSQLSPEEARTTIVKAVRRTWGVEVPEDLLKDDEMQLYKALYGPPARILNADEVQKRRVGELLEGEQEAVVDDVLQVEEIYAADPRLPRPPTPEGEKETAALERQAEEEKELSKHAHSMAENDWVEEEDEHAADRQPQQHDMQDKYTAVKSILSIVEETIAQQEALEEEDENASEIRTHPLTLAGRFSTDPSSIHIPKRVIDATAHLLQDRSNKHLREAAEQTGPASVSTDPRKKRENLPSPLNPSQPRMSPMDGHVFLTSVFPQQFAKSMATLVEVRRRLGGEWVRGVKKVLDVGTGGAAAKAWEEVVYAESIAQGWKKEVPGRTDKPQGGRSEDTTQKKPTTMASAASKVEETKNVEATSASSAPAETEAQATPAENTTTTSTTPTDGENESTKEEEPWDWGYGIEGLPNSRGYATTVIAGSDILQRQISGFMDNTLFLPRLPQYIEREGLDVDPEWEASQRHHAKRSYDLIVASDTIVREGASHKQKFHIDNLWALLNPDGGVLILIEHGSREGFSAIGGARAHLIKRKMKHPEGQGIEHVLTIHEQDRAEDIAAEKSDSMIIAPCTNHTDCPMWNTSRGDLELKGKLNYCHFNQRFIKPSYLLNLSKRRDQNHQDVTFSYLAVRKGSNKYRPTPENPIPGGIDKDTHWHELVNFDGPPTRVSRRVYTALKEGYSPYEMTFVDKSRPKKVYTEEEIRTYMLSMPRTILPPLKRKGHVHIDVCTSEGRLERWSVPRSYSDEAYHDARKSSWGDLWPLGAKTKIPREYGIKGGPDSPTDTRKHQEGKLPRRARENELAEEYEQRNKKHILDMKAGDEIEEPTRLRSRERNAKDFSKNKSRMIAQENRDNKIRRRGGKRTNVDPEEHKWKYMARKRRQYDAEMKDDGVTYY